MRGRFVDSNNDYLKPRLLRLKSTQEIPVFTKMLMHDSRMVMQWERSTLCFTWTLTGSLDFLTL
jgi:hypothetical protein